VAGWTALAWRVTDLQRTAQLWASKIPAELTELKSRTEPAKELKGYLNMIVIAAALLGALIGGLTARKRGGNRLDIAQYAAGYAMAFIVVGLIATVIIDRVLSV
jgi:hypothetical protein